MENGRWERIEALFHEAAAFPPADRPAFLNRVCREDDALRSEVESLLAAERHAGILQTAIAQAAENLPSGPDESSGLIGRRIGPYSIAGLIGKGGMGTVYRAMRDDDFRMEVAIKLLKRGIDTDAALSRFRTERQILAGLRHPNISALLDGGATDDGSPYFVMEYIEGEPLLQYAAPLPLRRRLELFGAVCSAVQHAHRKRIVHRDIKPANILVTRDGVPKLLDFGIAKLLDPESDGATTSSGGARLMTPDYASPEQVRGEPITTATDIYSLGAVLYELLTGRPAHHVEGCSPHEIEKEICTVEPPNPSAVAPDIDADLDCIVSKALRKDPRERYQSVDQLWEDIACYLQGVPPQARRGALRYRFRKLLRERRRLIAIGVLGVAVGLVLAFGLERLRSRSEIPVQAIAVLPFENLSHDQQQEYFADGITDALINDLARVHSLRVISRASVMSYKGVRRTFPEIARSLGVQTIAEGSVLRSGHRVKVFVRLLDAPRNRSVWSGSYEGDLSDIFALQERVSAAIASEIHVTLIGSRQVPVALEQTTSVDAYEAYLKGRYALFRASVEDVQRAIQLFQAALAIDPRYALAYVGLADSYLSLSGMYLTPREAMAKASAAATRALEINANVAEAHISKGVVAGWYDFAWDKAEDELKRAIDLNPNEPSARLWFGAILVATGKYQEGVKQVQFAHQLDPLSAFVETGLGQAYFLSGQYQLAVRQLHSVVASDPGFVHGHMFLGVAYLYTHQYAEAARELQRAMQLDPDEPQSIAYLAYANAKLGDREAAVRALKELTRLRETRYISAYLIAVVAAGVRQADIIPWLETAYDERDDMLAWLAADPIFDGVRADSRFKRILRSIGLDSVSVPPKRSTPLHTTVQ